MEKKQRKVDAQIAEWRNKHDALSVELENTQRDFREQATEVYSLKISIT